MIQAELQAQVDTGKSVRELASHFNLSFSTIQFWLRKFGIKTSWAKKDKRPREIVEGERYSRLYQSVKKRREANRLKAIAYLGGCCSRCKYDKFYGALEFHHKDPTQKDPGIELRAGTYSWERVKAELDRCILVCANCHREIHHEMRQA